MEMAPESTPHALPHPNGPPRAGENAAAPIYLALIGGLVVGLPSALLWSGELLLRATGLGMLGGWRAGTLLVCHARRRQARRADAALAARTAEADRQIAARTAGRPVDATVGGLPNIRSSEDKL